MKLVIDIPEIEYNTRKTMGYFFNNSEILKAVANGTPLSKGHGRLIDENELIDEIVCEEIDGRYYSIIYAHSIYDANTIIEADKEVNR